MMATTSASPALEASPGVDVGGALSDTLRSVLLFVPRLVLFAAILVAGWLVARFLLTAADKLLDRVGFDRAVERGGIDRLLARTRYDASQIVTRLLYYTALLVTAQLAFSVWGPNPVSTLISDVLGWLPRAIVAIVIVVVACAVARAARDIATAALGGLSYGRTLAASASWLIIGLGAIAALNQVGVASAITGPILVTVLATIGGILVVGAGGGLIRPMQHRWEMMLTRAEHESQTIADRSFAYAAGRHAAAAAFTDEVPFAEKAAPAYAEASEPTTDSRYAASPASTSTYISGNPAGYPTGAMSHPGPSGSTSGMFADSTPTEQLPAFAGLQPPPGPDAAQPAPPRFGDGSSAPMS